MANLRIDIASEFDNRGIRRANSEVSALDKAVDKLGKRLAGAFSAYKIAEYAKASVKAFAEDAKAAAVLAKTLENVNQGYQTDMVNAYIAKTEALYGILDDKLRPAFSKLVVATGDAVKSQALLQTALDVSAGTGKDLESVTAALSKAYLGNTTALSRLGAGLSKADLKGKNFNDIISLLNQNFSGAAATAAESYGGKIDRLNVAFKNMQETIGKGIIDAFGQLSSDQGFNDVITKMGLLAQYISDVTLGLGVIAGKIKNAIPSVGNGAISKVLTDVLFPLKTLLNPLAGLGAKTRTGTSQAGGVTLFLQDMNKIAAAVAKQNTNAKSLLNTNKNLTKEQKDQLALKKASLEVDKALGIFNLEKIELAAASMSKQTAEDYARIKLKQDIIALQEAINAGDAVTATKLAAIVEEDYKRVWAYQAQNIALGIQNGTIQNIQNAAKLIPQDMNLINLENLKSALNYINDMIKSLANLPKGTSTTVAGGATGGGGGGTGNAGSGISVTNVYGNANPNLFEGSGVYDYKSPFSYGYGNPNLLANSGVFNSMSGYDFGNANPNLYTSSGVYNQPTVVVQITDNAQKLVDAVTFATQNTSANGTPIMLSRNATNLAW